MLLLLLLHFCASRDRDGDAQQQLPERYCNKIALLHVVQVQVMPVSCRSDVATACQAPARHSVGKRCCIDKQSMWVRAWVCAANKHPHALLVIRLRAMWASAVELGFQCVALL